MKPLTVCVTYDENFEPMCSHLCSNLMVPGIQVRLNKTEKKDSHNAGFEFQNWYVNLFEKMSFLKRFMDKMDDGEIICVSDADVQFFVPQDVLNMKYMMESSDIEYMGQRDSGSSFNSGFFLVKKNKKTQYLVERMNSENLTGYKRAEQNMLNMLLSDMNISSSYLDGNLYLLGCHLESVSPNIVMHHAACAYSPAEKMNQMNHIRTRLGRPTIEWSLYSDI